MEQEKGKDSSECASSSSRFLSPCHRSQHQTRASLSIQGARRFSITFVSNCSSVFSTCGVRRSACPSLGTYPVYCSSCAFWLALLLLCSVFIQLAALGIPKSELRVPEVPSTKHHENRGEPSSSLRGSLRNSAAHVDGSHPPLTQIFPCCTDGTPKHLTLYRDRLESSSKDGCWRRMKGSSRHDQPVTPYFVLRP